MVEAAGSVPHRCALVTGASRGIGAAIARALAADGWDVGVNYRADREGAQRVVESVEAGGGRAVTLRADVADPAAVEKAFAALEEAYGPVVVLINNAGTGTVGLVADSELREWEDVIATNL